MSGGVSGSGWDLPGIAYTILFSGSGQAIHSTLFMVLTGIMILAHRGHADVSMLLQRMPNGFSVGLNHTFPMRWVI